METEKIVVGLDIGTTKICAIVGRKNEFGKLEVLGMGKAESEGVIKGIVTNIEKTIFAIEKAIKEAGFRILNVQLLHRDSTIPRSALARRWQDLSDEDFLSAEAFVQAQKI